LFTQGNLGKRRARLYLALKE